ncbi:uncharacterized protein zgc:113425 [Brachionichthys hirsutus]|uniref:uncharacterized protein zgc:113425 n=1 Tax=Brachionichthys hirsutus TaxID=412623 RepID=UPI0036045D4E
MDRYRHRRTLLASGILQFACAGVCVVCGFMDAAFRKDTALSSTRTPLWGALVMASPGVLALMASHRRNSTLVSLMVGVAGLSCAAAVLTSGYSCVTLTYGEDNEEVFHHHNSPRVACGLLSTVDVCLATGLWSLVLVHRGRVSGHGPVTFVLHRLVKGSNAAMLLVCPFSLALSCLIAYLGCRTLPCCRCYDARTGLEMLIPPNEEDTEMVCTWQGSGEDRLVNAPAQFRDEGRTEEEDDPSKRPPYSRLNWAWAF